MDLSRAWTLSGAFLVGLVPLMIGTGEAHRGAGPVAEGCDAAIFHRLDFWVGDWEVRSEGRTVGRNRVEKVLGGCAVTEHWRSAGGGVGRSLFYVVPAEGMWKQVWVTSNATGPGGVKEKRLLDGYDGPGVRFQGRVLLPEGGSYLDRTTLSPRDGGRVRQVIETSSDGGASWRVRFDAVYLPVERSPGAEGELDPGPDLRRRPRS